MKLITTTEAGRRLGVSGARVRVLIDEKRLPATKVTDRMYLIDPKDLAKVKNRVSGRPVTKKKGK